MTYIHKFVLISIILSTSAIALIIYFYFKKNKQQVSLFGILAPYLKIFYAIFLLFLIFFFILSSYRFFPPPEKVEFFESLIHHFDTTGLTIGIIGIIVGLITVIYVEKLNETNDARVTDALSRLDSATASIFQNVGKLSTATSQIHKNVTNLIEVTKIKGIFDSVKRIVKHADEQSNKLYILTHLTSFGQFLVRNVEILTRETQSEITDFKKLGAVEFYDIYMKPFDKLKTSLNEDLQSYVGKNKEVHFAVLRNERINPDQVDKVEPFIRERIMKGKVAILINKNVNSPIDYANYKNEDVYIHDCDFELDPTTTLTYSKQEDVFVNDILKNDLNFIKSLKSRSNGNLSIETLDYVPFQFFLSVPKNEHSDTDWLAVIIFSNYYNLGYDQSVVSFSTQNPALCNGLKKMFEKLVISQKKKDDSLNSIQKLFVGCPKISIALKSVDLADENISRRVGFKFVTPVPDILVKDKLLILFKEFDIRYSPKALYVKMDSPELKGVINHSSTDITYMAVGLFYNPVTEYLSNLNPGEGNPLFKLIHRESPQGKNRLKVAKGGHIHEPVFDEFEETFNDQDKNTCDYSILCRLRINGKWVYVGGGINYYGSEHFDECILYGATKISDKIAEKPFIALFDLKNAEPPTLPRLLRLSYVSDNKIESIDFLNSSAT